jgi:hypothetical protein
VFYSLIEDDALSRGSDRILYKNFDRPKPAVLGKSLHIANFVRQQQPESLLGCNEHSCLRTGGLITATKKLFQN